MPKFRNVRTGRTISFSERWAVHARTNSDLTEIGADGEAIPSEPSPVPDNDPALAKLRIADLRTIAADAGLDSQGTKAVLIARIVAAQADGSQGNESK